MPAIGGVRARLAVGLPAAVTMAVVALTNDDLRRRYADERKKRLRPDGNDQYLQLDADELADPYLPVIERDPVDDDVTVAIIGGGFAGLVTGTRLRQAGVDDIRIVDKGGDVGGTWYWNRYPGAQCDTTSLIYLPLLEETGHMPSEHYAHAPEILEHCERIAKQFGLYDNALFHTRVTDLAWDEGRARWVVRTDRGDEFTARFVTVGTGPLHIPKLPGIAGIETFAGHTFHTSRWDYAYTGGDPEGAPLDNLGDKRVAIIGTGATAVQCVPHLAAACKELYVFQRTPSSVDVRGNRPVDPDWYASIAEPGWQDRWLENFATNMNIAEFPDADLVADGWTDLVNRMRRRLLEPLDEAAGIMAVLAGFEDADFEKMGEIRARVDEVVEDPETAQQLKAWYRQLCKRPCFHDEYLEAYNRAGVRLVDTEGQGVERITERGVVVAGVEYEVDCIIYASGFEVGQGPARRNGFDVTGRDGVTLDEYWADGLRTMHGMHVHGFPNLLFVQPFQGANFLPNIPHNLLDSAKSIALVVAHALAAGAATVEVTKAAEEAWLSRLVANPAMVSFLSDCTPGYYNNEGRDLGPHNVLFLGYPQGASGFFRYIDAWRSSGVFDGLVFTPA